jgi:predicted transposase YbfD/YdcC
MKEPRVTAKPLLVEFKTLTEPRVARTRLHSLNEILVIAICGFVCGVEDWVDLEFFGNCKKEWFKTFLPLANGIPSHDTFGRVFAALDPVEFSRCFARWMRGVSKVTDGQVVAIDGKTLRHSFDTAAKKSAIHMVSAWATRNQVVLGQVKTDEKSNEITAIPKLLEMLFLEGCIVTIDAMGCQREIVERIVEKGADYVISLKGNQEKLHEEVKALFAEAREERFETMPHSYAETEDDEHGRIEKRRCWVTGRLDAVKERAKWPSLNSIGMVESERTIGGVKSCETRYFISSLLGDDATKFSGAIRSHWSVENNLHWVLDVAFREDESRVRKDNAPENMAMMRHVALNLLKQASTEKKRVSIKSRRRIAGWDHDFLAHVLGL